MADSSRTFEEASRHIQENLQRHLHRLPSEEPSDSPSSEEDACEPSDEKANELLQKIFADYGGIRPANVGDVGPGSRTKEAVRNACLGGSTSPCLICISGLKRHDALWSCRSCFCTFHLNCIQQWAKDSVFQQRNQLESEGLEVEVNKIQWGCPKCRNPYLQRDIPTKYTCYCGKVIDPAFDPWILPHSCGEVCGKNLKPGCGHSCLILCHPGPCPPCPKMVKQDCYCMQSAPATRRCFDKYWSCSKPCGRLLSCGQHKCPLPCHDGECDPCKKTSVQLCRCHRHQKQCDCATPTWKCGDKCGKPLDCGHHICDVVCHDVDECPPCPLSLTRRCPCGKTSHKLPCTTATPTCGSTCDKVLACEVHRCAERCHRGACGTCYQMTVRSCRCGSKKREVACAKKDFACEVKCKSMKDCGKHACNRKCCDPATCPPPCDLACNRPLPCRNHKCASLCHPSRCYPCTQTKEVSCNCGSSRLLVPCGMERTTKPPKCRLKCKAASNCHHERRVPHACHFDGCPPCKQTCETKMGCGHECPAPCHDNVVTKVQDQKAGKAATPWEEAAMGTAQRTEIKAVECPSCQFPVAVTCLGGHETADWPCFMAKPSSCGRLCGRGLECGNHGCSRSCHRVKNAPNEVVCGSNCRRCESGCSKPRPDGCNHPCLKPCHPGECETCRQMIRMKCHCGISQLYVKCGEWTEASKEVKDELACCKDQCPKQLECGHRCPKICHPDGCASQAACKKKTKVYCACKRQKQDVVCNKAEGFKISCNDECAVQQKDKAHGGSDDADMHQRDIERLQREEVEKFEQQLEGKRGGKRRKRRRPEDRDDADAETFFGRHKAPILVFVIVLLPLVLAYYLYN